MATYYQCGLGYKYKDLIMNTSTPSNAQGKDGDITNHHKFLYIFL